ncbi:MAG: VanZ family protein [Mariprofundaceae bacterium]|nr:VanZ family protein [Mariprofundaceae bacterium]
MNTIYRDGLLLLAYCGFIFFLSSQSTLIATPLDFPNKDKLMHASAYAILGLFAWRFFRHHVQHPWLLAVFSVLFASVYGITDEYHQSFVVGRDADIWDWVADSTGATVMVWGLYLSRLRKV